jgi:phage terminase Nu1 subunit (DNA packaging protein)
MTKLVNKRDLAEILGTSERSLTNWQKQGMPILREGERGESSEYSTADVIKWRIDWLLKKHQQEETPRDRLARRQAEMLEIDLAERRRESIPAPEIGPAWTGFVIASRQALRSMAADLTPALALLEGADPMRDLLEEAIDEALRNLAAGDDAPSATPAVAGGAGALGAAGADAAERVGGKAPGAARRVRDPGKVQVRVDPLHRGDRE